MQVNIDQKDIDAFVHKFTTATKKQAVRVKLNGEYIKVDNGKSCWTGVGPAKLAIRHYVHCFGRFDDKMDAKYTIRGPETISGYHLFLEELQRRGILEFIVTEV